MKTWLLFILIAISYIGKAQMEHIRLGPGLVINKLYAGFNSKVLIPKDSLIATPENSFRLGVLVTQDLNRILAVESQGAIQVSNVSQTSSIPSFELIGKITERLEMRTGLLVTPTTTTRPNPITWESQVETYAQSRIIGGRLGGMVRYKASKELFLAYAIHSHDQIMANHLRVDYKRLRIAGFYQQNGLYFLSSKFVSNRIDAVVNYSSEFEELASSTFFSITSQYTIYSDLNYRLDQNSSDVITLGARSSFENGDWHMKGFFGLAYDFQGELFTAQLFIHLF